MNIDVALYRWIDGHAPVKMDGLDKHMCLVLTTASKTGEDVRTLLVRWPAFVLMVLCIPLAFVPVIAMGLLIVWAFVLFTVQVLR